MSDKLKIILAGLGVRGTYWAEVIRRSPRCDVVAYADPNSEAIQRAAARFGELPSFETAEEAIAATPEAGALVLANPPMGREGQVRAAAARQMPMLIEKPLAVSVAEARYLVDITLAADTPLMVGLNFRYLGVTEALMHLIETRTVGEPAFARFTYERYRDGNRPDLNKYPLEMDHPMLWEQSIHHFDLMRYVLGAEPVTVHCHTWNPPWSMYRDDTNVAAIFIFDNGISVNYQGTWQSGWQVPGFEWRIDCTDGLITQKEQFGALFYANQADEALTSVDLPPHERWITETSGLLNAFLGTVMDDAPLQCSGSDHIRSLAMLEACVISSSEARSVSIESVLAGAQQPRETIPKGGDALG
ncbi:MAG: Gfo/Idh/MocA family oxidoreductase [Chloroflexota bacterium]